jgi:hypothetical protein
MSKTDIILLAWFSPVLIMVVSAIFGLIILFLQKATPVLFWFIIWLVVLLYRRVIIVLWKHYPRWWRNLPW